MKIFFNRALRISLATNAVILIAGAMLGPIYAIFVERIGGDLLDASIAAAAFAVAAGLTTFISGRFSDKVKESEYILVAGYVIIGIGYLLFIGVDTMWQLVVVQVIIGLGEAIYTPAFDAVYSRHLDHNQTGQQWGAWEAINYFATAAGALIGGYLVTVYGFTVIFIIMAALCLCSALYILLLPRKVL